MHPELVRLGVLDYVKKIIKAGPLPDGGGWLFPDVDRSAKVRNHSSAWGAWFCRYLKK